MLGDDHTKNTALFLIIQENPPGVVPYHLIFPWVWISGTGIICGYGYWIWIRGYGYVDTSG